MTGIIFDIDDTLYCRQDMLVHAAEIVLGVKIDDWARFITIFYEKSEINMSKLESGEVTTREINGWRYCETFKIMGLPYHEDDGVKSADAYLELQSHMKLSNDMIKVLDLFASDPDIKLAILTAGESNHQWHKVEMLGLERWFTRADVVITGETPYTKPDVRLMRMLEKKLNLQPSDLWMIGDSYRHDISGAIEAGWHSLWINRRDLPAPDAAPDIEVKSDKELTDALMNVIKSVQNI